MAFYKLSEQIKKLEKTLNQHQKRELKWLCERFPEILDASQFAHFNQAVAALQSGMPLAYVLGDIPFYGVTLKLNQEALIPRPETELLVDKIVKKWQNLIKPDTSILDLCSGSGAIAIALQKALGCRVDAVEINPLLCSLIEENARANGATVRVIQSDMFQKISDKYDLIVSNPPYIASSEIESLDASVKNFEPRLALDGGADGLDFYREIAKKTPFFLKKYGEIALEIGCEQKDAVSRLLEADFKEIKITQDYSGLPRFIMAKLR